jgi:class 3 adenylate cyclase/tetratricopeptide (TPR) repeat protein
MPETVAQITHTIAAQEAQRAVLGDAVVDVAVAPLRRELAARTAAEPVPGQQLKQVSVLFVDVVGSTAIGQQLGPEEIHAVMDTALERFTAIVQSHHGRVLQYTGDGMLAAFGSEAASEDDVESAIHAGLGIIGDAAGLAAPMRDRHGIPEFNVRAGIHTGTVLLGGGVDADGSIRGATVNVAARMEQSAPPGRLRISHDSYRHVRGLFDVTEQAPITVKGVETPLRTYLVDRVKPRAFRVPTRGIEGMQTRMVGREAELELLCTSFDDAVFERRAHVVHVVGEAGLGKSRLLAEFQNALNLRICWLLLGRAHPRSAVHPYGLLRDMLGRQFQIAEADPAEVAQRKLIDGLEPLFADEGEAPIHLLGHLIGLDFSSSPHVQDVLGDEPRFKALAFEAGALCLRRLGESRPVVVVLDDLHWSDRGTLDFMCHVLAANGDTPLLSVLMSRPTSTDAQSGWRVDGVRHALLELKPLDSTFSRELAEILLQRLPEVPAALRSLLTAGAEGNPFYMEELVKMLIDDGVIRVEADEWRVLPDKLLEAHVPATLTGVLQARIDALAPRERRALQQAAVVGHVFWDRALAAIDPDALDVLPVLLRKQLVVRRDAPAFDDTSEYAFQHNLLHQVVYDGVLKAPKRQAHASAGAFWSARAAVDSPQGVSPASCRALVEAQYHRCKADASDYVGWFEAQFSNYLNAYFAQPLRPLAEQMIGICERHFGVEHPETAKALTNLARVILQLGGVEKAEPLLRRAIAIQEKALPADHPDIARTFAVLGGYYSGRGDLAAAEPFFQRALDIRERVLGPEHPLTLGMLDNVAKVVLELGRLEEAEALSRRVLSTKERSYGPEHPDTAFALTALGEVLCKQGKFDDAVPLIRRALAVQEKTLSPDNPDTGLSMWHLSEALRNLDRCDEAERLARRALAMWESKLGPDHEWTAWGLISLAQTRLAQGAAREAATIAARAVGCLEALYGNDHALIGSTLVLQARALLADGDALEAEPRLSRALQIQSAGGTTNDETRAATRALLGRTREQLATALILAVATENAAISGAARGIPGTRG